VLQLTEQKIGSDGGLFSVILSWLQRHRTSVRWAFILRIATMAGGALFSLLFYRLQLRAMGDALNGAFVSFQAVAALGGLGDFGITGAVTIIATKMLGEGKNEQLKKLLSTARTMTILIAVLLCAIFAALSPWLPGWLGFHELPGGGSNALLFIVGGLTAAGAIISGYLASLNYANGTVTWPIIPTFVIGQILGPFLHWRLAVHGMPLWVQALAYVASSIMTTVALWLLLKWSHGWLGRLRPLEFDRSLLKNLGMASGWAYLSSLGWAIYTTTDRLVINRWIGSEIIPSYLANFKVCFLAQMVIASAGFVGFPKIVQWIMSANPSDQSRARTEINRLSAFQTMLACGIALGYLAFNDIFIRLWLGAPYNGPLIWQAAFAATLVVIACGDVGIQITTRCTKNGIRSGGLGWGISGLVNLGLSIVAVRQGPVSGVVFATAGVAIATVIAQSLLSISLNLRAARFLEVRAGPWLLKVWVLPLGAVAIAAALKKWLPGESVVEMGELLGLYAILFLAISRLAGVKMEMLRSEFAFLRSILKI
jgi:O-antigen/teichoic acid export membrane protein